MWNIIIHLFYENVWYGYGKCFMGPISYFILVEAYTYGCCKISHKMVLKFIFHLSNVSSPNGCIENKFCQTCKTFYYKKFGATLETSVQTTILKVAHIDAFFMW